MQRPAYPENEEERVKILRELLILDTPPEERFDSITAYCQSRFGVEIALVSLIDANRQWFKSACGLDAKETPREISFCGHAILANKVMIVKDTKKDSRFHDNPLVEGSPYIRFYAGAPLVLSSGYAVGTLCLIDSKPKFLEPEEIAHLETMAKLVVEELEKTK
jgi:GAF domain-containing protein